jgi:putative phosphoesterase
LNSPEKHIIGLVSDTHGLLRNSAIAALAGSDRIIHAGDIDTPEVLRELEAIAPVTAVRGNMDGRRMARLPENDLIEINGILIYIIHDRLAMDLDPLAAGISVVIFGHSHRPVVEKNNGVFYINPGSAGPRRFSLPISVGRLEITGSRITPVIIELTE